MTNLPIVFQSLPVLVVADSWLPPNMAKHGWEMPERPTQKAVLSEFMSGKINHDENYPHLWIMFPLKHLKNS